MNSTTSLITSNQSFSVLNKLQQFQKRWWLQRMKVRQKKEVKDKDHQAKNLILKCDLCVIFFSIKILIYLCFSFK